MPHNDSRSLSHASSVTVCFSAPRWLRPTAMLTVLLALVAGGGAGCARGVNLKTWQKDVERYVEKRDNDPAVLRDVTLGGQGGRRGFAVIGKDDARVSTDANGVLVAHESALNRPWFVYLVGVVDEQKVKEIRVAALSMLHGKATWRVGPKDPEALKRYRDAGLAQYREQHPVSSSPQDKKAKQEQIPSEYTTFPRSTDQFDATINGSNVQVIHKGSDARWEVNLAGEK